MWLCRMNEYENMTKEELLTRCLFLDEVVAERNEQIEKMKCCVNCSKYRICEKEMNCDKPTEKYCDDWELAE